MCWIKLHRQITEWEWYTDSPTLHLFIHLLLTANYEDKKWRGIEVKRGQIVTSQAQLQAALGMTRQQVRRCLSNLIKADSIAVETTKNYSIVTLCNYDRYNYREAEGNQQTNQQMVAKTTNKATNKATNRKPPVTPCNSGSYNDKKNEDNQQSNQQSNQQTTNRATITKEEKKERNIKERNTNVFPKKSATAVAPRSQREQDFYQSLIPYVEIYGQQMVRAFYNYWTEPTVDGKRIRKELQKTWDTARRLANWAKRNQYGNNQSTRQNRDAEWAAHVAATLADDSTEEIPAALLDS